MIGLPKEIRKNLLKEAKEWDISIAKESAKDVQVLLNKAEPLRLRDLHVSRSPFVWTHMTFQ